MLRVPLICGKECMHDVQHKHCFLHAEVQHLPYLLLFAFTALATVEHHGLLTQTRPAAKLTVFIMEALGPATARRLISVEIIKQLPRDESVQSSFFHFSDRLFPYLDQVRPCPLLHRTYQQKFMHAKGACMNLRLHA